MHGPFRSPFDRVVLISPDQPDKIWYNSRRSYFNISSWQQSPHSLLAASGPPSSDTIRRTGEPSPNQHNSFDWGDSALGPADFFPSLEGSIEPLVGNWSLGLENGSGSSINGADWSLPLFEGAGTSFVFQNEECNGQLNASETLLPSCELSPDLLFNSPAGSQIPPLPDAENNSNNNNQNPSVSPPTMPESSSGPASHYSAKAKSQSPPVDPATALKRQRNNAAARKYRQKRIDRINELETELRSVKEERDDLRLRLARQEAETAALRSMLQMNSGKSEKS
ncbi:hypothetical protein F4811DRAFT_549580 [Daldinia bambusicola]|nr:hypothetical protein F4811DRAFT_549580 [Daldinia bambusicola]